MRVNGEPVESFVGTLSELLSHLSVRTTGVAVAINGDVVPRSSWATTPVRESDEIEIVTAAAGG